MDYEELREENRKVEESIIEIQKLAGEQGKGFAVVASEVQKLADQSKSVVQETQKEEGDMVKCITKVLELSDSLGTRMDKINTDISIIAQAITDIATKSDEIVKRSQKLKI